MPTTSREMSLTEFAAFMHRSADDLARLDYTPPLKIARELLISDTKDNFAGSHGPDGAPWKPLAMPARTSSKEGGSDQPLRDKGMLMASVTSASGPGVISEITSTSLEHGTNLDYASIHQHGGTITPKSGKMLSIPLTREARAAGGARQFPRPLFLFKRPGKTPLLAEDPDKGVKKRRATWGEKRLREHVSPADKTKLIFHYLLVPSVVVPQREFLGWSEKVLAQIDDEFLEFLEKKLG